MSHLSDTFRDDAAHSAVMLVDLQVDFLRAEGRLPVAQGSVASLLDCVRAVVDEARAAEVQVIHVVNAFPRWSVGNLFRKFSAIDGSPGAAIDDRVPQRTSELVFRKQSSDAFSNPELESWAREQGIERLLVMGVYADGCVSRTVKGALARGIAVTVPRDGVASGSQAGVERGLRAVTRAGATSQ